MRCLFSVSGLDFVQTESPPYLLEVSVVEINLVGQHWILESELFFSLNLRPSPVPAKVFSTTLASSQQ